MITATISASRLKGFKWLLCFGRLDVWWTSCFDTSFSPLLSDVSLNAFERVIFLADFRGWTSEGHNFHFRTSLMTSSSSLCRPCTQPWIRAKLESLKVPLERYVFMIGHAVKAETVALFCRIYVFKMCFFLNTGQVSEPHMWGFELAD